MDRRRGGWRNSGPPQIRRKKPKIFIEQIDGLEGHADGGGNDLITAYAKYDAQKGQSDTENCQKNMIWLEKIEGLEGRRRWWGITKFAHRPTSNTTPKTPYFLGKIDGLEGHADGGGEWLNSPRLKYDTEYDQSGPTKLPTSPRDISRKIDDLKGPHQRRGGNDVISDRPKYDADNGQSGPTPIAEESPWIR